MSKTYEALKRAEALRAGNEQGGRPETRQEPLTGDLPTTGADDFYELRQRLVGAAVGDTIKSVMVVSALHGEGTSTVACLMAKALAERGRSNALLVDLNLRTPSLWRLMDAKGRDGITGVVAEKHTVDDVIQETEFDGLKLITAGNGEVDAIDVIDNPRTLEVVTELGRHADAVFLDAPPITLYPDARALAPLVDGVILVVEADVTPVGVANRAVELIRESGANIVGAVLNKRRDYIPERVLQLIG